MLLTLSETPVLEWNESFFSITLELPREALGPGVVVLGGGMRYRSENKHKQKCVNSWKIKERLPRHPGSFSLLGSGYSASAQVLHLLYTSSSPQTLCSFSSLPWSHWSCLFLR